MRLLLVTEGDKMKIGFLKAVLILLPIIAFVSSCTTPTIEKAFKTGMDAKDSNKIINEYCEGCHVHKDFERDKHVEKVRTAYTDPAFSSKTECRACHTYTKTWLLDVRRGTHWPVKK